MKWNCNKNITIIEDVRSLLQFDDALQKAPLLTVDTETTGLGRFCQVVGVSLAWSEDDAIYIPIQIYSKERGLEIPWSEENYELIWSYIKSLCLYKKRLLMHNAVFDVKALENTFNFNCLDNIFCDTQLLAHTAHNEEGPLKLKDLAALLLTPDALNPQDDVRNSVKERGGSITKKNFEMYKCDHRILGIYCAYDSLYTFGVYNRLYPEIKKQNLEELWEKEVMALLPVTYALNNNGIRVDLKYFEELKIKLTEEIKATEDYIYNQFKDKLEVYETEKILSEVNLTGGSVLGKLLVEKKFAEVDKVFDKVEVNKKGKEVTKYKKVLKQLLPWDAEVVKWYKEKYQQERLFNFNSPDDKAFLLFQVWGLQPTKLTDGGDPSADADTIFSLLASVLEAPLDFLTSCSDDRIKELCKDNPVALSLKLLLDRASLEKMLKSYVLSILKNHIDGRIYASFMQTGTTSGRLSCGKPLNLQTLNTLIKKGFIPEEGEVLVENDYSQLEIRCFAHVSGEPEMKRVFIEGLDFYSKVVIDTLKTYEYSAHPKDKNFMKKVNPELRDLGKTYALALGYGAEEGRLSQITRKEYFECQEIRSAYFKKYTRLQKWMQKTKFEIITKGFVRNLVGRVRRSPLLHNIYKKYGVTDLSRKSLYALLERHKEIEGYTDSKELYLDCRNAVNNSYNFAMQSLAAALMNAALILFNKRAKEMGLKARIVLQVHDSGTIACPIAEKDQTAKLLQECMENNWVSSKLDVAMEAKPVVCYNNLSEAKAA